MKATFVIFYPSHMLMLWFFLCLYMLFSNKNRSLVFKGSCNIGHLSKAEVGSPCFSLLHSLYIAKRMAPVCMEFCMVGLHGRKEEITLGVAVSKIALDWHCCNLVYFLSGTFYLCHSVVFIDLDEHQMSVSRSNGDQWSVLFMATWHSLIVNL